MTWIKVWAYTGEEQHSVEVSDEEADAELRSLSKWAPPNNSNTVWVTTHFEDAFVGFLIHLRAVRAIWLFRRKR